MHDFQKLSNHPLVLALAEFRFSAVLDIEKHLPSFQELIRKNFPLTEEFSSQEVSFNANGIEVREIKEWAFISKNKKSAVMLNNSRLVFLTGDYDRFDGFKDNCRDALRALSSTLSPSLLMRVGLRYSDTIISEGADNSISEYVDTSIQIPACLDSLGTHIRHVTENVVKTSHGIMVVRSMSVSEKRRVWPDLHNLPITIKYDSEPTNRILLDFDHYWEPMDEMGTGQFDVEEILIKLDGLHKISRNAFWNVTTENGRAVWK